MKKFEEGIQNAVAAAALVEVEEEEDGERRGVDAVDRVHPRSGVPNHLKSEEDLTDEAGRSAMGKAEREPAAAEEAGPVVACEELWRGH